MKRFFALLALIAVLVPLMAGQLATRVEAQDAAPSRPGQTAASQANGGQSIPPPGTVLGFDPDSEAPFDTLDRARQPALQNQVRIQSRVVIRIGPAAQQARRQMLSELPRRPLRTRYEEVEHDDCIDAEDMVGVQPTSDNRLLFFTGADQILAASLEDGCSARAFYAGFFIERSEDGQLCVARDRLQSRAGASCEVDEFTRLVAVAN